jgi:hypothetical protein
MKQMPILLNLALLAKIQEYLFWEIKHIRLQGGVHSIICNRSGLMAITTLGQDPCAVIVELL